MSADIAAVQAQSEVLGAHDAKGDAYAGSLQVLGSMLLKAGQPENAYTAFWKLAMVGSQRNQPRWVGAAQGNLGACASMVGDKHRASWHFEQEALFARQLEDKVWEGRARCKLASSLRAWALTVVSPPVAIEGMSRADVEFALSLQLAVEGEDSIGAARARSGLATMMEARGDYQGALQIHSELIAQRLQAGDRSIEAIRELTCLAVCVARNGGAKRAAPVFSFYKALFDLVGDARLQARASGNLGAAECLAGRLDVGLRWHMGMLKSCLAQSDWPNLALCLSNLKPAYAAHGGGSRHAQLCEEAILSVTQGASALFQASSRLAALPPPERPMSTARGRLLTWGIEEVTSQDSEAAAQDSASQSSPSRGAISGSIKVGPLKQRVGILSTWKDRRVSVTEGTMEIRRLGSSAHHKAEDSLVQTVDLSGCTIVERTFARQPFGLELRCGGDIKILLAAASVAERQSWIQAIISPTPWSESNFGSSVSGVAGRVGIGAVLWQERAGGAIFVQSLVKGSVAEVSGIMPGDQIKSANGVPVDKGLDVVAVTHVLGGERGTKLKMELIGGAQENRQDKVYSVELVRS